MTLRGRVAHLLEIVSSLGGTCFGRCATSADEAPAVVSLLELPTSLLQNILLRVQPSERLLFALVSRAARMLVDDPLLWKEIAIRGEPFLEKTAEFPPGLLRRLSTQAGQAIESLAMESEVATTNFEEVLSVLSDNKETLRELNFFLDVGYLVVEQLASLVCAAPELSSLICGFDCVSAATACSILRNDPPWKPLHVVSLRVKDEVAHWGGVDGVASFCTAVAQHPSPVIFMLTLKGAPLETDAAMSCVVDAARAKLVASLHLEECECGRSAVPHLARFLNDRYVHSLAISNRIGDIRLLDELNTPPFCCAIRSSRTLTSLTLMDVRLWAVSAFGVAVVQAVQSSPSIKELDISYNVVPFSHRRAVGVALAALVAANTCLHTLNIEYSELGDKGLNRLVEALRSATSLRSLSAGGNDLSEGCARCRLLPAVLANTSLMELILHEDDEDDEDDEEDVPLSWASYVQYIVETRSLGDRSGSGDVVPTANNGEAT